MGVCNDLVDFYRFHFILRQNTYLLYINKVDPDPTPHIAASDLSLHYKSMSLLWDPRLKNLAISVLGSGNSQCKPKRKLL